MVELISEYMTWDHCLDALGFVTGILYLYWEYFADPKMWIAELIMPLIMCCLFFDKGLYADFSMNIYYFGIAIYGYIVWTRHKRTEPASALGSPDSKASAKKSKKSAKPITRIPARNLIAAIIVFACFYALIAWWLVTLTDSTVPYWDAFTTALSIVAMWMLARKYVEQWIAWILVDIVSAGLYFYKGIPLSALRYIIYTVIAVFGYIKWRKLMKAQPSPRPDPSYKSTFEHK